MYYYTMELFSPFLERICEEEIDTTDICKIYFESNTYDQDIPLINFINQLNELVLEEDELKEVDVYYSPKYFPPSVVIKDLNEMTEEDVTEMIHTLESEIEEIESEIEEINGNLNIGFDGVPIYEEQDVLTEDNLTLVTYEYGDKVMNHLFFRYKVIATVPAFNFLNFDTLTTVH